MKKKLISIAAIMAIFAFASCDTKLCYCYESTSTGVYEQEVYVQSDTPCSSMNRENRGCVERNERMDPGEIAK